MCAHTSTLECSVYGTPSTDKLTPFLLPAGAYARWPDLIFSFFGPQVFNKKDMDESTKGWAAIITLLVCSLPLQTLDHTQLAPGMSAIKIKIGAIGEAMSVNSELMGEAKDTMQQLAASSAEAQRQREEEEEEEKEGSAVGSKQQQEDPIPKRSKPKRICIAWCVQAANAPVSLMIVGGGHVHSW